MFDIDDTLYLERDYVRSGFAHVARVAAELSVETTGLDRWLWSAFESGVRGDTFDQLLVRWPELAAHVTVADLVSEYRRHTPQIAMLPGTGDLLARLADEGVRLGVLSDGPFSSQQAKVDALGLGQWFDPIVLTSSRGGFAKPAIAGFVSIAAGWRLSAGELAYIADNPTKDFIGPRQLGWRTVRLRMVGQVCFGLEPGDADHRADIEAVDLSEGLQYLQS